MSARFHRKYIDANRDLDDCAVMEGDELAEIKQQRAIQLYELYHTTISDAIEEMKLKFPGKRILMLDIHGHVSNPTSFCQLLSSLQQSIEG